MPRARREPSGDQQRGVQMSGIEPHASMNTPGRAPLRCTRAADDWRMCSSLFLILLLTRFSKDIFSSRRIASAFDRRRALLRDPDLNRGLGHAFQAALEPLAEPLHDLVLAHIKT